MWKRLFIERVACFCPLQLAQSSYQQMFRYSSIISSTVWGGFSQKIKHPISLDSNIKHSQWVSEKNVETVQAIIFSSDLNSDVYAAYIIKSIFSISLINLQSSVFKEQRK